MNDIWKALVLALALTPSLALAWGCATAPGDYLERQQTYTEIDSFFQEIDARDVRCHEADCNPQTHEGCDNGMFCDLYLSDQTTTCSASEPVIDYCCTPGSRDECGPKEMCLLPTSDLLPVVAMVCAPAPDCDPVTSTGCDEGQNCLFHSEYGGYTSCVPAGSGSVGTPCISHLDCRSGTLCVHNIGTNLAKCKKQCEIATNRGCSGSQMCGAHLKEELKYGSCD